MCTTAHANAYTAGKGVTGHSCPPTMKEGDTCVALCAGENYTHVGTIKCLSGDLQDVSMCVPTGILNVLPRQPVTKLVGSWSLKLSKEPSNVLLTNAVVAGLAMPKQNIECVWRSGTGLNKDGLYQVNYWVIPKPGQKMEIMKGKLANFLVDNTAEHLRFKEAMEGVGMTITSMTHISGPLSVDSIILKDPEGRNLNPFTSSPGESLGLSSWM